MFSILNFTTEHIEQAQHIARQNYESECRFAPSLPQVDAMPDLRPFAENGLGVTAFKGDEMVGFLCSVPPFKNVFRSTDAVGVFSPMGANGTVPENRAAIYARLYQMAGNKWVKAGACSHAVCLYAHDKDAQEQFFRYGFGLRCVDAIRGMDAIEAPRCVGYDYSELKPDEFLQILPLEHMLDAHMAASPTFILRMSETEESFIQKATRNSSRFFAAKDSGKIVAFLRIERDGETFIRGIPGYIHVNGAFCLLEYRSKGIYSNLLNLAIHTLKVENHTRLGVDFESINPTAYDFWLKHFDAYTHSVVRRIDEHAISKQQ
jgi:hypothetical protein